MVVGKGGSAILSRLQEDMGWCYSVKHCVINLLIISEPSNWYRK